MFSVSGRAASADIGLWALEVGLFPTTIAAAPSANNAFATTRSACQPYWKCSEQSSTQISSTRAPGSDSANDLATRIPLIAP